MYHISKNKQEAIARKRRRRTASGTKTNLKYSANESAFARIPT